MQRRRGRGEGPLDPPRVHRAVTVEIMKLVYREVGRSIPIAKVDGLRRALTDAEDIPTVTVDGSR